MYEIKPNPKLSREKLESWLIEKITNVSNLEITLTPLQQTEEIEIAFKVPARTPCWLYEGRI